jgi:hypothetical protein
VTISGRSGADAKPYQEKQVRKALEILDEDAEDGVYVGKCPDLICQIQGAA